MGATTSQHETQTITTATKKLNSPFSSSLASQHDRLISDVNVADRTSASTAEQQRLLTLREYQQLRATRSQSQTARGDGASKPAVSRNSSAPCLSSRSSSSSSNLSSADSSSSSRHLSPRQRTQRYTSACVHPQFQCNNCSSTCNIVPYNTSANSVSSTASTASASPASSVYSDASSTALDQSFCNRDCYFSYCFRLSEEMDVDADAIIENYCGLDGGISLDHESADLPTESYPASCQQQMQAPAARCLQISRVH